MNDRLEDGTIEFTEYDIHWEKYAIADLDRDGTNELVYYVFQGGDGYYLIFRVMDGEVYGYSELYRNIDTLYQDGTMMGESGASYYWYWQIDSFEKDGFNGKILAKAEDQQYSIDDKAVTESEFFEATSQWCESEETTWIYP